MCVEWKPNSIDTELTAELENPSWLHELVGYKVRFCMTTLQDEGWRFYGVHQKRGRCYVERKIITIPVWAAKKAKTHVGYLEWYIAHECAHAIAGIKVQTHGQEFMQALISLCNPAYLHYETNYKPREAFAAGISSTAGNKVVKVGKKTYDLNEDDLLN